MNRRRFLRNFTLLTAASSIPSYFVRTLSAARRLGMTAQASEKILCVVELNGGWDGLYSIIPHSNDIYYQKRPTLGVPFEKLLAIDDDFGFHPALVGLKSLFDEGRVSIVQGVGYPNPNRSHFRSQDIWYSAEPSIKSVDGWLGKYLSTLPENPLIGVSVGSGISKSLLASNAAGAGIRSIESFRLDADPASEFDAVNLNGAFGRLAGLPRTSELAEFASRTVLSATQSSADILEGQGNYNSTIVYPDTALATEMQTVARLIAADVGIRVFYLVLGGFDTHAFQVSPPDPLVGRQARLIEEFSGAVKAFHDDLTQMGRAQDVLTMTVSEFGRRLAENASSGTDHGTANPMLLIGDGVRPGFFGQMPSLAEEDLDSVGDMKFRVDFRQGYATVLGDWLGADADTILGGAFDPLDVLI